VLASVARTAETPRARLLGPARGARLNGARGVTLRWSAADADGDVPDVSLEYSADGGKTYRTVVQGAGGGRVTLPRNLLAASTRGRLRLRATDGFNTTVTPARPIVVLARRPSVQILEPRSRDRVQGGAALYLQGAGVDDHGRNLSGRRLRWYAGRKLLGIGATLSAVLPAGTRVVRLVARDRAGRVGSASVGIRMQATTPLFLRLTAPARLSRRARTLRVRVASTVPATLRLGSQHHSVGPRPRGVRFRVRRGRSTLRLRFVLQAGRRASAQYVLVRRR
jgi:hypothetical protein